MFLHGERCYSLYGLQRVKTLRAIRRKPLIADIREMIIVMSFAATAACPFPLKSYYGGHVASCPFYQKKTDIH